MKDPLLQKVRDYWDRRPCNLHHSPKETGTVEYFNEVETRKYFVEPHIPRFAEFPKWKDKKVLEIGCGIGTDSINFVRAGAHLTTFELSPKSLDICKSRFNKLGLQLRSFEANAEVLEEVLRPHEHRTFDLLYAFGVIHHSPRPLQILKSGLPFLKAGGELRVMVYYKYSFKHLGILLFGGQPEAQERCPLARFYSKKELRNMVKKAGYQVLSVHIDHIFQYELESYKKYEYRKRRLWRILPKTVMSSLERLFGAHLMIRAIKPFF